MTPLRIRPYAPADLDAVIALFQGAVRKVASRDYAPAQVMAWAPDDIDRAGWAARRLSRPTWIAEQGGEVVGFTDLEPDGHLDMMFVHADHQRQGIASALLATVEAAARRASLPRVHTEASLTARPFFLAHGFTGDAPQTVVKRGVAMQNYAMQKPLPLWAIRPAQPDQAAEACAVIRTSIEVLCMPDHAGDPAALGPWLANKTPEVVRTWITSNPAGTLVATGPAGIAGVGAVKPDGTIVLNYVAPWARLQGIGRGLVRALEAQAVRWGRLECRLTSTVTAHAFYLALGYRDAGEPIASFGGKPAYPMRRSIR